jgi:hypothetical protein
MPRATWFAKHWRVYPSITTIILIVRPSSVRSSVEIGGGVGVADLSGIRKRDLSIWPIDAATRAA